MRTQRLAWISGAALVLTAGSTLGATFVKNPSFENNVNTNSAPLAAGAPQGWPYYGPIDDWNVGGGGVNDLVYDPGGPFHNSGTPVPDGRRVGFKQGGGSVSQDISGLATGKRYWIQFRYDARNGSDLDLAVRFSTVNQGGSLDAPLDVITKPKPAIGTASPYYSRTVPFTPDTDSGTLSFEVTSRGDSTILLDAVTIVQRDEGQFPVMNPSFEASGTVFDGAPSVGRDWPAISGWAKKGEAGVDDGTGGEADNGRPPDQDLVAFIRGEGSLTQTLEPLVKDESYQVSFAYNARSGTSPKLQVKLGDAVLAEIQVSAVGGVAAYATRTVTFKATGDTANLTFSNLTAGATVLLDDVKVVGKVGTRLPPLEMAPARTLARVGGEATVSMTIPQERLALGPAVVKLRSANPNVFRLPLADPAGILSLDFAGGRTQTFRIQGVSVGNAAIEITDSAGLLLPTDITAVYVVDRIHVLNPSFELDKDSGVGTAPIAGWVTGGGNIGIAEFGNPFLAAADFTAPDRRKVLRMQGGGTASQEVTGLKPGQLYGLQFFYNGRSSGYPYSMSLKVSFDGKELLQVPSVVPAAEAGGADYYFHELRFRPESSTGKLEFKATVTSGDATLFLDAVSIVPRIDGEIAVRNSSFEATATGANWPGYLQPDRVAGWTSGGGGYGVNAYSPNTFFVEPFFDNGINSDQDNVFFGQGGVSLSQTLEGLSPGQPYTLVFDYNNRDGRGQNSSATPNTGEVTVSLGGEAVFTSEAFLPVDTLSPWPGFRHRLPMYQALIPFKPAADTVELRIQHTGVTGDETMLIDQVRVVPGTRSAPVFTQQPQDQTVDAGATATFAVDGQLNLSFQWLRDGVYLTDGALISGATSRQLQLLNAAAVAGNYTVIATDGIGVVGSVVSLVVNPGQTRPVLSVERTAAGVRLRWPSTPSGFRLQRAGSPGGTWSNVTEAESADGADRVVALPADGVAGFFRLTN